AIIMTLGPVLFFAAHTLVGIQQHLALYLTGQGVAAARAAFALSMILGGSIIGRLAGGVLADRFSARVSLIASIACLIAAIAGLLTIVPASPMIPAVAAVFGLGYGG